MIQSFLIGFVLPWIFGIWLYLKNPKVILTIAPFMSVVAFTVNQWGYYFEFWDLVPILKDETASAIPLNLGIYPVLSSLMIHLIQTKKSNPYLWIFILTIFTTFLELICLILGKVVYHNGWNIFWTFVSYLIPYWLTYLYYKLLKHHDII
ncbi:CBO0543 family protein [Scopulibacillus cellulosilyticus]|uniref:CBO0543 family protein n=1 Tax=Scopulibacillus cellulosilyticus TaxID=2665665 RepID=A0ABW2PYZ4_9BACL